MYPVMAYGIRTGDPRGFNKGRSSKFREGSRVRQTPEECRRTYRPKRCSKYCYVSITIHVNYHFKAENKCIFHLGLLPRTYDIKAGKILKYWFKFSKQKNRCYHSLCISNISLNTSCWVIFFSSNIWRVLL